MDIKQILEIAQELPNELLVNELRKHCESYMSRRSEEALKNVVVSCMVICAKHKAGDTPETLAKAVKEYDLTVRGKNLLTTYEN